MNTIQHSLPKGDEPRCALEVNVKVGELQSLLSFICIHNDFSSEKVRGQQIETLLKSLRNTHSPVILAGDFNGDQTDKSMKLLGEAQWEILDKKGKKTFPSDRPEIEIDFFALRGFQNISIEHDVINEQIASDHRPIYAVITHQNGTHSTEH